MSKKKKRVIKRKQIKKPIVRVVEVVVEPIEVAKTIEKTKRKYHRKRKYVRKQPIVQVEQTISVVDIIPDKPFKIQFDIIPKKLIYGIIIAVMMIPISIWIIVASIPPEPVIVNSDGSYLAMQVN
jgi:hypothetical protein